MIPIPPSCRHFAHVREYSPCCWLSIWVWVKSILKSPCHGSKKTLYLSEPIYWANRWSSLSLKVLDNARSSCKDRRNSDLCKDSPDQKGELAGTLCSSMTLFVQTIPLDSTRSYSYSILMRGQLSLIFLKTQRMEFLLTITRSIMFMIRISDACVKRLHGRDVPPASNAMTDTRLRGEVRHTSTEILPSVISSPPGCDTIYS